MKQIQMVDLRSQYLKIKPEIDQSIFEVIDNTTFINGTPVKEFEAELGKYLDSKHVVGCANGTDALQIALMALDLEPGDEVITTPFTFVATAEVIALLNLKPVFVDVDPNTFNLDVTKIEEAITERSKCIIPVHLFGQSVDMDALMKIANKHSLFVVEDNAQAIGAEHINGDGTVRKTGSIGHIGCVSFFPSKNLSCFGDGGALYTQDDGLYSSIKRTANHGSDIKYYYESIGVNSRLDSIQAAILRVKLRKIEEYIESRRKVADFYDNSLGEIDEIITPHRAAFSSHVFHQYTMQVDQRDELQKYLKEKSIPSMIYYPLSLHQQKAYKKYGYGDGDFPIAENLSNKVLSLPIHTEMEIEQLEYITNSIQKFFGK